tara:strand:+ start:361 stop:1185 length:825 start_codon:yes stop_codon:yes gene_type:complete
MLIKIDTREGGLHAKCMERVNGVSEVNVSTEMLPLGDIILCDDEGNELVIIERKTLNDLAASIRDGRYKEQGFRLNNCDVHNHNIIYLVEGNLRTYNEFKARLERKALLSSFISLTYFKGFTLHRTETVDESAEWIISYASKLQREKGSSFYQNDQNDQNDQNGSKSDAVAAAAAAYVNVSSRVKKNNITVDNIGAIMLAQIPGVSAAVATAVMAKYGTLKYLIAELSNNPASLDDITIATKTNKTRKISRTSCQNIYSYLVVGEKSEVSVNTE